MSIFKKQQAVYFDKMDVLQKVTVTEDTLKFQLNYSTMDMKPEDVPKLLADLMQLYAIVKPILDKKSEAANKEKEGEDQTDKTEDDAPIDLSDIPF